MSLQSDMGRREGVYVLRTSSDLMRDKEPSTVPGTFAGRGDDANWM